MATASPFDAALRNVLDRLHSATRELGRHDRMPELGERAVDIALALLQIAMCVFNHIPLLMQVCQRASADGFRLQCYSLGLPQSL